MLLLFFYLWLCFWCLKCFNFLKHIIQCYLLPGIGFTVDIREFGEWAVITGSTDGIGKCYAFELAKRKFNIVLISRTKAKIDIVAKEIEEKFGVKTKSIVFDFSTPLDYDILEKGLEDLDIGVLVNNVGTPGDYKNLFEVVALQEHLNVLHTNIFGELHLTHFIMKGMLKKNCGAIIHISSSSGYFPIGLFSIYAPTKAFVNAFVTNLQKETKLCKNIHHQLVTPFMVVTNMTKAFMKKSFTVPDAESYVSSAINTVGITSHTFGCLSHELLGAVLLNLPGFILRFAPLVKAYQTRCDNKRKESMLQKDFR